MNEGEPSENAKGILHPEGMRAVRDFARGVVHEVNNILGVIIGNAHLAKKSLNDSASVEKYLGEVRDAAEEGRELMRNLAILAGASPVRARALFLNDLVNNAVAGLHKPVHTDLSSANPAVELDLWLAQDALGCVLLFMTETTSVTSIRVATRVVDQAVVLTLEDDGGTPSDEQLAELFAPFSKADRRPKTGMRLAKLANLAARSGGRVGVAAREPTGLRIVLTLPVASAE